MKHTILLTGMLLFIQSYIWSQGSIGIGAIVVLPNAPTINDTVRIKGQVGISTYGAKIFDSLSVTGDTINIFYCIAQGIGQAPRTFTDTFTIGVLPQGAYTIDVKAYESTVSAQCIPYDSAHAVKTFIVSQANAVQDLVAEGYRILLFPNPATSLVTVGLTLPETQVVRLELFDMLGRKVNAMEPGKKGAGTYRFQINTNQLAAGMYLMKISIGEETVTHKVQVQ